MSKSDILIIGSGLTALSYFYGLKENCDLMDTEVRLGSKVTPNQPLNAKTRFNSSHMFESERLFLGKDNVKSDIGLIPLSYAYGGFSTVWGNGINILPNKEIAKWPVDVKKFSESYLYLLSKIPHTITPSELDYRFPWPHLRNQSPTPITPDFEKLLGKLLLKKREFLVGPSRLSLNLKNCKNCGLCISGCPYGALLDSGEEFDKIRLNSSLNFIQGKVLSLTSTETGVSVKYQSADGAYSSAHYKKVVLAAGPLSTAKILLESKLIEGSISIKDSQMFYGAIFSLRSFREPQTNLAQLVIIAKHSNLPDFSISLYAPSIDSRIRIQSAFKFFRFVKLRVPKKFNSHIIPIIGFLDSEMSGQIKLSRRMSESDLRLIEHQFTSTSVKKIIKSLKKPLRGSGFYLFKLFVRLAPIGQGFHIGGSLPIGSELIDANGCLRVDSRIQIVDASVLPKIPAGSHTFTAMAMAHYLAGKRNE